MHLKATDLLEKTPHIQHYTGSILWVSLLDSNGIILDSLGNELYFDSSTSLLPISSYHRGSLVSYRTKRVNSLLVAYEVTLL